MANFSWLQRSVMHYDKTGQCSEGRISVESKASISLGCDSWGLVGDTKLRENTRINDNFHTELVLICIFAYICICIYRTSSRRKLGQNSPGVRIHVARHMRDGRMTRALAIAARQYWEVPGCCGCWKVPLCLQSVWNSQFLANSRSPVS